MSFKEKNIKVMGAILFLVLALVVGFQNCSSQKFDSASGSAPNSSLLSVVPSAFPSDQFKLISANSQNYYIDTQQACGVTTIGELKCWGLNYVYYVIRSTGLSEKINLPTTLDLGVSYSSVSVGLDHTCAVSTSGVLKCWGAHRFVAPGTSYTNPIYLTAVDSSIKYTSVSAGNGYTCGITEVGQLKCWGDNGAGQLGDGTTTDKNFPTVQDSGESYLSVSVGFVHSCGITTAHQLKCWGRNDQGIFGDVGGYINNYKQPTVIDTGISYSSVSVSGLHVCAITMMGQLKCWGSNRMGNLGDGSTISKAFPQNIDLGIKYKSISASSRITCGVTESDQLKCWGFYQIAAGSLYKTSLPRSLDDSTSYQSISAANKTTCGIQSNGQLKCWFNP